MDEIHTRQADYARSQCHVNYRRMMMNFIVWNAFSKKVKTVDSKKWANLVNIYRIEKVN